jgi:mRNA-degrading endonuclease RelE of RelBE toxin-antitoxin system
MIFIESAAFTRRLAEVLDDDAYAELQAWLAANPRAGAVITDTGGLRKVRWAASGRGKRGGARVIYYYVDAEDQIWLLLIYAKNVKDDLGPAEKRALRQVLEKWNG